MENDFPQVSFEITNKCNLSCRHCCNDSGPLSKEGMTKENIFSLINDLKTIDCKSVYLSGGEPTCHPDFDQILEEFHKNGISVTIATNGLETLDHLEVIKRTVSNSGVFISIDGIGKTHDKFRGKIGSFEKALETIKTLVENNIPVRINSTIWKGNNGQEEDLILLAKELGVNRLSFLMLYETGRAKSNDIFLDDDEYLERVKHIHQLIDKYLDKDFRITLRRDEKISKDDYCPAGIKILHIDYLGNIYPCSWVAKSPLADEFCTKFEKGNILQAVSKNKSFQELFMERKERGLLGCPAAASTVCRNKQVDDPLVNLVGKDE